MDEPMVPAPASVGVVGISPRFSIPPAATDQAAALEKQLLLPGRLETL